MLELIFRRYKHVIYFCVRESRPFRGWSYAFFFSFLVLVKSLIDGILTSVLPGWYDVQKEAGIPKKIIDDIPGLSEYLIPNLN